MSWTSHGYALGHGASRERRITTHGAITRYRELFCSLARIGRLWSIGDASGALVSGIATERSIVADPADGSAKVRPELDNINDLLDTRHVALTSRRWMEPYHSLEDHELRARLSASREHQPALVLWLRQIALFHGAFNRAYDWSGEPDRELAQSRLFRLDFLCLAGTNFKLALDAVAAGYYSGCMALERHMLETWRRVAYARLSSEDIWRWYPRSEWPDNVIPTPKGAPPGANETMPTVIPSAKNIAMMIESRGTTRDKEYLPKVTEGFSILNDHAHPTLEGTTQTWHPTDPNRRVFGPTFSDLHARRCLTWGLVAGMMLLEEVFLVEDQGKEWLDQLNAVSLEFRDWLRIHQD